MPGTSDDRELATGPVAPQNRTVVGPSLSVERCYRTFLSGLTAEQAAKLKARGIQREDDMPSRNVLLKYPSGRVVRQP